MGLFGGYIISNLFFDVSIPEYVNEIQSHFKIMDISIGLVKSFVFGAIISVIGCFVGFSTHGGAEGVGKSTVRSFVITSVLILISDLLVVLIML
jgi:phospholipid/cholesterol/gamma-HCH transport system permease protein